MLTIHWSGWGGSTRGRPVSTATACARAGMVLKTPPFFSFLRVLCLHRKTIIIICHDRLGTSICANRRKTAENEEWFGDSIEHNHIEEVSYTGISYNWPEPQGASKTENERRRSSSTFFLRFPDSKKDEKGSLAKTDL